MFLVEVLHYQSGLLCYCLSYSIIGQRFITLLVEAAHYQSEFITLFVEIFHYQSEVYYVIS